MKQKTMLQKDLNLSWPLTQDKIVQLKEIHFDNCTKTTL